MPQFNHPIAPAWADVHAPCAVIDIHAELLFWENTYASQPFHRPGTPFRHYVPTLKFAYDIYLLSHRQSLQELMPSLPARYHASILRGAGGDRAGVGTTARPVRRRSAVVSTLPRRPDGRTRDPGGGDAPAMTPSRIPCKSE